MGGAFRPNCFSNAKFSRGIDVEVQRLLVTFLSIYICVSTRSLEVYVCTYIVKYKSDKFNSLLTQFLACEESHFVIASNAIGSHIGSFQLKTGTGSTVTVKFYTVIRIDCK